MGGRVLGGNTLGQGGFGGYRVSGTQSFLDTLTQRGQTSATSGATATDFAPWGGQIAFDTLTSWYFDSNTATTETFSGNDFYSVALHEIGHVLGLGTADSWTNKVSGGNFIGENAVAAFGGNVPLTANFAHWQEGTRSTTLAGLVQEAMMDPTLTTGTRKLPTRLDFAALNDVWKETAVPVPAAFWLFGSALVSFAGLRRRQPVAQS